MTEVHVPIATVYRVCDRAVLYRWSQVEERSPGLEIEAVPYWPPFELDADDWAMVGTIADGYVPAILKIWWHQGTDRIRVEKPPVWPEHRPPLTVGDPLYRTDHVSVKATTWPFTARPGYIYTFDGVEYDHEATEVMTRLQGSIEGWTWREQSITDVTRA